MKLLQSVLSKKDAHIVKDCIRNLSDESQKKFMESYLDGVDLMLPDVREDNLDDLNAAIRTFNNLFTKNGFDSLDLIDDSMKDGLVDELTSAVVKFNSGAVCETGSVRMFMTKNEKWRYLIDGIDGKYTVFFDSSSKPSELCLACYKKVSSKEAKKIGRPKMEIICYLNIIDKNKK